MSDTICPLSFSYPSLSYCLFKMQYFLFRSPTQPKQYSTSLHWSKYSLYLPVDDPPECFIWYPPSTTPLFPESSKFQENPMSMQSLDRSPRMQFLQFWDSS